jgi:hypothetical protein
MSARLRVLTMTAVLTAGTLAPATVRGQTAAPASASPSTLGRLFYTPGQRQDMDRRRQLNIQEVVVINEVTVTVNGQITRSSGRSTTWVNGVPQHDAYPSADPSVVAVAPGQGEAQVRLKVGQSLDRARRTVTDDLKGGSVSVDRPRGGR